jgi:hypothetical protein
LRDRHDGYPRQLQVLAGTPNRRSSPDLRKREIYLSSSFDRVRS